MDARLPLNRNSQCEAVRSSQVKTALSALAEAQCNIATTLEILEKRLVPVLRSEPTTPCQDEKPCSQFNTPIAADIQYQTDKLVEYSRRLNELNKLLEV